MKHDHGTYVAYVIDRCRCELCRDANRRYNLARRNSLEPAYVGAGPARDHVRELMAAGVGLKTIAKRSGVPHGTLSKLVYGIPGRPPSKRVRRQTLERLLTVSPADAAAGARVDAAATWKLIDEMVAAGAPKSRIAEALGQSGPGLQLGRDTVAARNARAVADLHRRWTAGEVTFERRDSHGGVRVAVAPPRRRDPADVSDLLLELAEIVEERNAQPWRSSAACRGRPQYLWFPARGDHRTVKAGLDICAACTVRADCRAANLDRTEGTYGGLTAGARRRRREEDAA
jgi:hypothetical protein